jgi:UDP-N-acetylglucosamine 2-epimerase (non-hydrolysing)
MTIDFVLGTRPELLKLIPVIRALERCRPGVVRIVDTLQQSALKEPLFAEYQLTAIPRVKLTHCGPSLARQLATQVEQLGQSFAKSRSRGVVVQGDTTTALAGTLAAFYAGLPVVHVEAGLRSYDPSEPFPEEMHRRMIACAATRHLAPNEEAREQLIAEGVAADSITVLGNPLYDLCQVNATPRPKLDVLVGMHRRENRPQGIRQLCAALGKLARRFPECQFGLLDHSHPVVSATISEALEQRANLRRLAPMPHREFLSTMANAGLVMTDSGGVQEEAALLAKRTLVLRRRRDRSDGLDTGTALCVDVSEEAIVAAASQSLNQLPHARPIASAPYAVGEAAARLLIEEFQLNERESCLPSTPMTTG